MKKISSIFITVALLSGTLTGCSSPTTTNDNKKINIVCTIFPQYDWVMNLLGDKSEDYNVTLLVNNGTDLHNYQPSAKDIITIKSCDMLIYVGGTSDQWISKLVKDEDIKSSTVINMMEVLGSNAVVEEYVEGMEHSHKEHSESKADSHSDSHSDDGTQDQYDEHIWLSLHNAELICNTISSELCKLDQDNAGTYSSALSAYTEKLKKLDVEFTNTVSNATRNTILFGDRFPFRYMVDDYGLDYYAAFAGCSAETEASFQTIVFLAEKMDELSLPGVCITESTDQSLAKTIIDNTNDKNQTIFELNSMQSITTSDIEEGVTYLSIMEGNLDILKTALN